MPKFNFYAGAFTSSLLLALLVIIAELAKPLKDFLASVFTHHWVGKAVLVTLAFVIAGFFYKKDEMFGIENEKVSWYGTLGSFVAIFLFFVLHYFIA